MMVCKKRYFASCLALMFPLLFLPLASFAEIAVIAHPESGIQAITVEELKDIYLRRKRNTMYGKPANPIDLEGDDKIREKFYQEITNRTTRQMERHWSGLLFAGEGSPPRMLNNQSDIVSWVAEHKDAIAFVDKSKTNEMVKVIFILQ